jgi:hypothetical protein
MYVISCILFKSFKISYYVVFTNLIIQKIIFLNVFLLLFTSSDFDNKIRL